MLVPNNKTQNKNISTVIVIFFKNSYGKKNHFYRVVNILICIDSTGSKNWQDGQA